MKRTLLPLAIFFGFNLVGIASIDSFLRPAVAGGFVPPRVINALAQPNSSERFFEEGRQRLEREIQLLRQGVYARDSEILKIDPAVFDRSSNSHPLEPGALDRMSGPREPNSPAQPLNP
ncbi:hypothetical protein V0288_24045 [Pannus brasiliensis CCIBt3594]|uniref:Uncharacterized protein n=1 Tax=Pannus brasiliensis CCIBt3594 TaxID=1427578 RepID=A0AAW9R032_9CHRO